jgi:hypothetical protein
MLDASGKTSRTPWTAAEWSKYRAKLDRDVCKRVFGGCAGPAALAGKGPRDLHRDLISTLEVRGFAEMLGIDWHATTDEERDALWARLTHQWRVYNGPQVEDVAARADRETRRKAGRKVQARVRAAIDARTHANNGGKSTAAYLPGVLNAYAAALGVDVKEAERRVEEQTQTLRDAGPAVVLGDWGDVAPFDLGAINDKEKRVRAC